MVSQIRRQRGRITAPQGNIAPVREDPFIPSYADQHILDPTEFDTILRNESYSHLTEYQALLDTYASLARDCHVSAVLQSRVSDVVRRELQVKPFDAENEESVKHAEFIQEVLENLGVNAEDEEGGEALITSGAQGFDEITETLLSGSLMSGFAVGEVMWQENYSEVLGRNVIVPAEIRMRKQRRFGFKLGNSGYIPRLITRNNRSHGIALKPRKFIFHHHNLLAGPYGLGLGHNLYWPVQIKRENITFWGIFNEKFGSPTVLWKYPLEANPEEKESVEAALQSIQQDAVIGIPDTFTAELLEAMRSGSITTYTELNEWCDNQISKCVLGQTGTTDQSDGGGSRARDEVAERVSFRIAKRDSDMLGRSLQQSVVKWTMQINFGFNITQLPKVTWAFPELEERVDLNEASQVDERLVKMSNRRLDEAYLEDKYEVVFGDEIEVEPAPVPGRSQPGRGNDFSEPADPLNRPIQDAADDIASQALERSLPILDRWQGHLDSLLKSSKNYAEFQRRLFTLFNELEDGNFVQLLTEGMATAKGVGVDEAQSEGTESPEP